MPLLQRPPVATNRWDLETVDDKHHVALTLGRDVLGWAAATTLQVVVDGPSLTFTDRPGRDAAAEVRLDARQNRAVLPGALRDALRLTPGTQVFLEADVDARQLRLYPVGVVE